MRDPLQQAAMVVITVVVFTIMIVLSACGYGELAFALAAIGAVLMFLSPRGGGGSNWRHPW